MVKSDHHLALPHFDRASPRVRRIALLAALLFLVLAVSALFRRFEAVGLRSWKPGVGAGTLALDAGLTLLRLSVAYFLSLALAVAAAVFVTSFRWAETWLLPVFDVLQSVPVLAFFPVAVSAFAAWGFVEGAAALVLVTAMLWSLLFSLVGAIRGIPKDVQDAARIFGASRTAYLRTVVLPACFPALVTGSILALGAGWNIIIVAEYINYGGRTIILPGLGSLLDHAVYGATENHALFLLTLLTMVAVIIAMNRLLWRRLLRRARRYTFD